MEPSPGGISYALAVSAVAALTGLTLDPTFGRITVAGAVSGALFLMMWIWLAFDTGRWPRTGAVVALQVYWVGLPGLVTLLDLILPRLGLDNRLERLRELARGLLFSANYLLSWLFHTALDVSLWWGAAAAVGLVLGAWLMGDASNRRGVERRHD